MKNFKQLIRILDWQIFLAGFISGGAFILIIWMVVEALRH